MDQGLAAQHFSVSVTAKKQQPLMLEVPRHISEKKKRSYSMVFFFFFSPPGGEFLFPAQRLVGPLN